MATRRDPSPPAAPSDEAALEELGLDAPGPMRFDDDDDDTAALLASARPAYLAAGNEAQWGKIMMSTTGGAHIEAQPDWVRLIWMTMKKGAVPNYNGANMQQMIMTPFCVTQPMPPLLARDYIKQQQSRKYGYAWQYLWAAPPETIEVGANGQPFAPADRPKTVHVVKTCGNRLKHKHGDRKFRTCPLANCPLHPRPAGIHHSVWMAQRYIANLESEHVIAEFVRTFDPRPDVVAAAQYTIELRQRALMEAQEMGQRPMGLVH